jgi:predicted phage gp36 major capsid-like protein
MANAAKYAVTRSLANNTTKLVTANGVIKYELELKSRLPHSLFTPPSTTCQALFT